MATDDPKQNVLIEVYQSQSEQGMEQSFGTDVVQKVTESFTGKHMIQIASAIDIIQLSIDKVLKDVSEVEVEFGIKLAAEAGVIVASASTEATLTVRVVWKK